MKQGKSGLWLVLVGTAVGPGVLAGAAGQQSDDELLQLLEYLGDDDTASATWKGFFDSLPERLDDTAPDALPVVTEEPKP